MTTNIFLIRGFAAVAISCGMVLACLSLKNESGVFISLWLGFISTLIVAIPLAAVWGFLHFSPGTLVLISPLFKSLSFCLLLWVGLAVAVMFFGTLISTPQRVSDFGLYVPIGSLYGGVSGVAFWWFANGGGLVSAPA